jgi:hypothetical protein
LRVAGYEVVAAGELPVRVTGVGGVGAILKAA